MDFLIVNNNKLKIMMTRSDMQTYELDPDATSYDDPAMRRSFWRILDVARERCGFDATGEKLLIHFYPSGEGGELFVTKLGKLPAEAERTLTRSQNVAFLSSKNVIYKFSDLSSLIAIARHLSPGAREKKAALYLSEDEYYYLVMEERGGAGAISDLAVLGEFGYEVPYTLEPYIAEHSKRLIATDALALLSSL